MTWSIQGDPEPVSAARDSVLTINVDPVTGAQYYGAFVMQNDEWISESRWVRANENAVTQISLPMLDCEPGTYQIYVYAAKSGVPRLESAAKNIEVTAPSAATAGNIIFTMKRSFAASEPLQLRALYTNPYHLQNAWMHIRIYNKNNPNDRCYDEGRGFDFRDEGFSIDHSDTYVLEAQILQDAGYGNEPTLIEGTSFEITVYSPDSLDAINLTGIPALHPANTDLTFNYNKVTGAEQYDITLHYCPENSDWEELASFHPEADEGDPATLSRTFDKALFSREGRYRVWIHAAAYNKNGCWDEQYFHVINGDIASTLELVAEDDNGVQVTAGQLQEWPSSKYMEFRLHAPDPDQAQVQAVRFLNFEGHWEYRDGNNQNDGWFTWGDGPGAGQHVVVAQAAYNPVEIINGHSFREMTGNDWGQFNWNDFNWEEAGFNWTATSNQITVNAYSYGQLRAANYTTNLSTINGTQNAITRGEDLVVTIGDLQNENEWYGARIVELDGWEHEYWSWDDQTKTIVIPTADFEAGAYRLMVWADAEGIEGMEAFTNFTIVEPAANGFVFHVSATEVVLGQEVAVSIYAPGSRYVGFSVDGDRWDIDEQGRYTWGLYPCWTNNDDVCWYDRRDVGTHTLQAWAYYSGEQGGAGHWEASEAITVTVNSHGNIRFDLTSLPAILTAGVQNQSVTINLPDHAEGMHIGVYEDWDDITAPDGYRRNVIFPHQELHSNKTVDIPVANLIVGHRIVIDMDAWAYGYAGDGASVSIPIINASGQGATLSIVDGDIWTDEQTNTEYLLVDGNVKFQITPDSGNTLKAVRFFDGDGFWEWGNPITPQNHPDWFENGKFFAWCGFHDTERNRAVYAEVQLNDSDVWITTNVIPIVLKVYGVVGAYDFTSLDPITANRGDVVSFTFEAAAGADHYWIDAFDMYDRSYNPYTENEPGTTTVELNTLQLSPGEYRILGRAGAKPGWQWSESTHEVRLTVVEGNDIDSSKVWISVDPAAPLKYAEADIIVHAPDATEVQLFGNYGKLGGSRYHISEDNYFDNYYYAIATINGIGYRSEDFEVPYVTRGQLDTINNMAIVNNNSTVTRGEMLQVTYSVNPTYSTDDTSNNAVAENDDVWFNFEVFRKNQIEMGQALAWSGKNRQSPAYIPIEDLEPGEYVVLGTVDGVGYDWSENVSRDFTVADTTEPRFTVSKTALLVNEEFSASLYIPNAAGLEIWAEEIVNGNPTDPWCLDNNEWKSGWSNVDSSSRDDLSFDHDGTFRLFVKERNSTTGEYEVTNAVEPITITVTGPSFMPALAYSLNTVQSIEDGMSFTVYAPAPVAGELVGSCQVRVNPMGAPTEETFFKHIPILNNQNIINGELTFNVPVNKLEAGRVYNVSIWHVMNGKDPWSVDVAVAIIDPVKVLTLPAALTGIEEEAFAGVNAQLVVIPDGVTTVGNGAFANSSIIAVRYHGEANLSAAFEDLVIDNG